MDDLSLKIEKITGQASETSACSVFTKKITLSDQTLGTVVSLVKIADGSGDLATILRDIFELSTKKLEATDSDQGILAAVRMSGEAIREYVGEGLKLNFVLAFFYKDVCYIAREGQEVKILVFDPPKQVEITFEHGSGPIKTGQIYLIATEKFLSLFDVGVFTKEAKIDLEDIIDGLATEVSSEKDQSEIGAGFVLVKREEMEESRETERIEDIKGKEETEGTERVKDIEETEEIEESDDSEETEADVERLQRKIRSPIPFVLSVMRRLFLEIRSLKRGDIRAVFRLRRNIIIIAFVIILVLVFSAFFTLKQRNEREKMARFNAYLGQASSKYTEGTAVSELNKSRAREILTDADKQIKLALEINKDNQEAKKLESDILAKLKETETTAGVSFQTFYEGSESIGSLSILGKKVIAIGDNKIISVDVLQKKADEIEGPQNTSKGCAYGDSAFVLAGDKIFKVDLTKEKLEEVGQIDNTHDLCVFLGNIYVVTGDQIAKFVPVEGGYSRSGDYLNEKMDLGADSRLAIDGSIWLTKGDKIFKFLRGERQDFEISGLTGANFEFGEIYTNTSLDNLYVVDRANSALLVIGKDGLYQKAYQSAEFGKASDLIVSEDGTKMYLSVDSKILEANLE